MKQRKTAFKRPLLVRRDGEWGFCAPFALLEVSQSSIGRPAIAETADAHTVAIPAVSSIAGE